MPKLHTKPKQLPPRKDLHVLVNEESDDGTEVRDLTEQKSEGEPEQEPMFKLRKSSEDKMVNKAGASPTVYADFKEGDKVRVLSDGQADGGRENIVCVVRRVYPRAKTLQVAAFNGVSRLITFGEAVPEKFWA